MGFPVCTQSVAVPQPERPVALPLTVFHAAEQLVIGVLDAVLMVVGQMWQWWLVFSQRVVARVGVVLVVTMWNIWDSVLRVDGASCGEGHIRSVLVLLFLTVAVEQQQGQQQDHQQNQHHDAHYGSPGLPLTGGQGDHDTA